eukprot:CAMPEP_0202694308 /NCGR_PEP_ID=MMETSP1385-20130828/8197_1 /ASSEMBLY_ACC=CAM_ASM_000861 /TAXON_ID=933848 /ORGANISM="Elphidium margaritaceum" /LENGTH=388 /DNA_ID=CAMNT_0049350125 /DNA_START=128 /DNA_END=1291 /DNA_ORIENTATION=-
MIFCHCWFLVRSIFMGQRRRRILTEQIKQRFLKILNKDDADQENNVVVTHSCRTIFYCIIESLLQRKQDRIKIGCCSMQFGSFYTLLRSLQMDESRNVHIDFYEIDLNASDCSLDTASVDEQQVSDCDLIICQHFFGVPLSQTVLFELGKKYDIPVLEDCVQSGSLFGQYKGHQQADVCIWSCGLDKTPSCFGGGLGYFANSKHGQQLLSAVNGALDTFAVERLGHRAVALLNQTIHLVMARNHFSVNAVVATFFYFKWYKAHGKIKWYDASLKMRKNKSITPFQHQASLFLSKPSIAQLYSIRYGLNKNYSHIILNEITKRKLFLDNIPKRYHTVLFPWLNDKALKAYEENRGVGEFSWVFSADGDRIALNDYLCDHYIITMINTTW